MHNFCENFDYLEQLSDCDAIEYKQIYAQNLPKHLPPHHFLLMQLRWKEELVNESNGNLSQFYLKLYRPRKCDKKFCTFFGISGGESADIVSK